MFSLLTSVTQYDMPRKATLALVHMSFYLPKSTNRDDYAIWNDKGDEFFPPYALSVRIVTGSIARYDKLYIQLQLDDIAQHYQEAKAYCERLQAVEAIHTPEEQLKRKTTFTALMKKPNAQLRCWQTLHERVQARKASTQPLLWYIGKIKKYAKNEPPKPTPGAPPPPPQPADQVVYSMMVLNRDRLRYPVFPMRWLAKLPHQLLLF